MYVKENMFYTNSNVFSNSFVGNGQVAGWLVLIIIVPVDSSQLMKRTATKREKHCTQIAYGNSERTIQPFQFVYQYLPSRVDFHIYKSHICNDRKFQNKPKLNRTTKPCLLLEFRTTVTLYIKFVIKRIQNVRVRRFRKWHTCWHNGHVQ